MAKGKTATTIIKKKRWIPVQASADLGSQKIGELHLEEPAQGIGRTLDISLMTITGDPSRQSTHLDFKITKQENNTLQTEITGYHIITAAVRKMMHRERTKIEDSFVIATKDKTKHRIKPIIIAKGQITGGVKAHIQRDLRSHIIRITAEKTYNELIKDLISHQFQKQLQQTLRKIYPLSTCEIKSLKLAKQEEKITTAEAILTPAPAEEEYTEETEEQQPVAAPAGEQPLEPPAETTA